MSTKKKPAVVPVNAKPTATASYGIPVIASVCCQTVPVSPLVAAMDKLNIRLDMLAAKSDHLISRIAPLVAELPLCGACPSSSPRPVHSAVVDRLDSLEERATAIYDQISDCLDRLEV